jgi:hypothetical protein
VSNEGKTAAKKFEANYNAARDEEVTHVAVPVEDAAALLDYIEELERLRGDQNGIALGDRVGLYVYPDPEGEEGHQPETGVVVKYVDGGYLIKPDTGEYKDTKTGLWYASDHVTKIEGEG